MDNSIQTWSKLSSVTLSGLASYMGVNRATLYRWRRDGFPRLAELALRQALDDLTEQDKVVAD